MRIDRSPRLDGRPSCPSSFCALADDHEGPHEDTQGNTWVEFIGVRCIVCRCWLQPKELPGETCQACLRDL